MLNRSRECRFAAGESYDVVDEFAADALTARGETMPELDEIETLRMLAGHVPRRLSSKHVICIQELVTLGLCTDEPYRITWKGLRCLEIATGIIDLRSRRVA